MSLQIENILGNLSKGMVNKVNANFSGENKTAPVPAGLNQLNELVGFPYRLLIDWQTIVAKAVRGPMTEEILFDLVSLSITNFLDELLRLLNDDERFSEEFLEKTKVEGRKISVLIHPMSQVPFTRINETSLYPMVEFYLPEILPNANVTEIANAAGKDLPQAVADKSPADPFTNPLNLPTAALPRVIDLPGPALALSEGRVYIRIIETIAKDGRITGFTMEGYPPVVEILRGYIQKHRYDPWGYGDISFYPVIHRFGQGTPSVHVSTEHPVATVSALVLANLLERHLGFESVETPKNVDGKIVWLFRRGAALVV